MDQLKTLFNDAPLKYYIFPFLAHALGTLSGAWLASKIAISYQKYIGFGIGCCFLIGGLMVHYMIQGPPWFITIDLFMAYVPMGLLGWKFAKSKK